MSAIVERRGHVGLVLLDEPSSHHALSRSLVSALLKALDDEQIRTARAVVISSTGPSFCAGANIGDLLEGWMVTPDASDDPVRLFRSLAEDPRPTIAAVDGAAIGGGFELMLSCDLAVASSKAWFALPELAHGVIPNTALMRVQQMIGLRGLYQLMMTGQKLDAQKACDMGLVSSLCEPGRAVDMAVTMADEISSRVAPGALAAAKRLAMRYAKSDWGQVQESLQDLPEAQWREGLTAFLEKRKPDYDAFWSDYRRK
ncbi:enoyl-CoA hydratase/isomerase family protein [Orrella marina]|uniref:Enoyl-CoA hydratase/isomerase family protein n=1 Tax=Orrella marina TaxID=2163011 RepID=A0A2R4XN80_9BURK|nr:enoyl-CoA hydratase/isomerase family protein [Orrella marina]AWB35253.1 enoyl-CoA hydratase/isomerase family protein [Orrella marina]